jgi:ATP-dependent Lhr-like helicase
LLPPQAAPLKRGPASDADAGVRRASLQRGLDLSAREADILETLREKGASFFGPLHEAVGAGYPGETVDSLWNLVWRGLITNDTFHALRAFTRARAPRRKTKPHRHDVSSFRSRRLAPPSAEGRWTLVPTPDLTLRTTTAADLKVHATTAGGRKVRAAPTGVVQGVRPAPGNTTKWAAALTQQLLARHGVLTREAVAAESVPGGFGIIYPVLKGLEEHGRIRRGYFVAGLGATQFAMPGALDLLRSMRDAPDDVEVAVMAATDPANPYGATLKWPAFAPDGASARQARESAPDGASARQARGFAPDGASARQARESAPDGASARQARAPALGDDAELAAKAGRGPTRSVGATVILVNGALAAYLARGDRQLVTFLPESEPDRSKVGRAIARVLIDRARTGGDAPRGMLIEEIDGTPASRHPLSPFLTEAGFVAGAMGFQATFRR